MSSIDLMISFLFIWSLMSCFFCTFGGCSLHMILKAFSLCWLIMGLLIVYRTCTKMLWQHAFYKDESVSVLKWLLFCCFSHFQILKWSGRIVPAGFQVDDEAMELNKELISKLLELDDVDAVYTDQIWSNWYLLSPCQQLNRGFDAAVFLYLIFAEQRL